jgi:dynein heavy chain, axonemal
MDKASNVNPANATNPIKTLKAQYRRLMSTYVDVVEKTPMLTPLDRKKLTSLIILEEHHREIIDKLYGVKGVKREHFEWLSQCRFTLQDHDAGQESLFDVKIEQMNATFLYGCEYMGNQ